MSTASLIMRIVVASVAVIAVGVILVLGFTIIEPFYEAFGDPPASLGWGSPGSTAIAFASFGGVGLLLVIIVWFVAAPIQRDQRQQFR